MDAGAERHTRLQREPWVAHALVPVRAALLAYITGEADELQISAPA
jgi:hypothetical protein